MVRLGQRIKALHPIPCTLGRVLEQWSASPKWRRLGDFLQAPPTPSAAYQRFRGIFSHREAQEILSYYCPESVSLHQSYQLFSEQHF